MVRIITPGRIVRVGLRYPTCLIALLTPINDLSPVNLWDGSQDNTGTELSGPGQPGLTDNDV